MRGPHQAEECVGNAKDLSKVDAGIRVRYPYKTPIATAQVRVIQGVCSPGKYEP